MTVLHWPPFADADVRLAVFAAFFLIALGAGLGLVVGSSDQGVAVVAQEQYGRSVVNTTYTAVDQQVQMGAISPWLAIAGFVAVIIAGNLLTTAFAALVHRWIAMPLAVAVTSYLLVYSGFIPALVAVQFATRYGALAAIAALAPHGCIELVAMALAGAAGLLAATAPSDEARSRAWAVYLRRVAPLIVLMAVVEVVVTPVVMFIVMR